MLAEKNDNLLEADGNLENNSPETIQTETTVLEDLAIVETSNEETAEQIEEIASTIVNGELPAVDTIVEEQAVADSEMPIEPVEPSIVMRAGFKISNPRSANMRVEQPRQQHRCDQKHPRDRAIADWNL